MLEIYHELVRSWGRALVQLGQRIQDKHDTLYPWTGTAGTAESEYYIRAICNLKPGQKVYYIFRRPIRKQEAYFMDFVPNGALVMFVDDCGDVVTGIVPLRCLCVCDLPEFGYYE